MADTNRIRELVNRAVTEPEFGKTILEDPESAATEYGLTSEQVNFIQKLNNEGVLTTEVEAHMVELHVY